MKLSFRRFDTFTMSEIVASQGHVTIARKVDEVDVVVTEKARHGRGHKRGEQHVGGGELPSDASQYFLRHGCVEVGPSYFGPETMCSPVCLEKNLNIGHPPSTNSPRRFEMC